MWFTTEHAKDKDGKKKKPRRYRCSGLTKEQICDIEFMQGEDKEGGGGKRTRILDYFADQYKINIKYPHLPGIEVRKKYVKARLPAEGSPPLTARVLYLRECWSVPASVAVRCRPDSVRRTCAALPRGPRGHRAVVAHGFKAHWRAGEVVRVRVRVCVY